MIIHGRIRAHFLIRCHAAFIKKHHLVTILQVLASNATDDARLASDTGSMLFQRIWAYQCELTHLNLEMLKHTACLPFSAPAQFIASASCSGPRETISESKSRSAMDGMDETWMRYAARQPRLLVNRIGVSGVVARPIPFTMYHSTTVCSEAWHKTMMRHVNPIPNHARVLGAAHQACLPTSVQDHDLVPISQAFSNDVAHVTALPSDTRAMLRQWGGANQCEFASIY
jgi:hypothetical protein